MPFKNMPLPFKSNLSTIQQETNEESTGDQLAAKSATVNLDLDIPLFDFYSTDLPRNNHKLIEWHKVGFDVPSGSAYEFSKKCTPMTYADAFYASVIFKSDQLEPDAIQAYSTIHRGTKKYKSALFKSAAKKAKTDMESKFSWKLIYPPADKQGLLNQQNTTAECAIHWQCRYCKDKGKVGLCAYGYCEFVEVVEEDQPATTTTTTTTCTDATTANPTTTTQKVNAGNAGFPKLQARVKILMLFPHDKMCTSNPAYKEGKELHPKNQYMSKKMHYIHKAFPSDDIWQDIWKQPIEHYTQSEESFKDFPAVPGEEKLSTDDMDDRAMLPVPFDPNKHEPNSIVSTITEVKFAAPYVRLTFFFMQQNGIANDMCPFKIYYGPTEPITVDGASHSPIHICGYQGHDDDNTDGAPTTQQIIDEAIAACKTFNLKRNIDTGNTKPKGTDGVKRPVIRFSRQLRWYPNPRFHLYFDKIVLTHGGMSVDSKAETYDQCCHQKLHRNHTALVDVRVKPNHPMYQGIDKEDRLVESGSCIIPILKDQPRRVYILDPLIEDNLIDIEYDQMLWFSGAWLHGGFTYPQSESLRTVKLSDGTQKRQHLFRPAFQGHIDSIHIQRTKDYPDTQLTIPNGYKPFSQSYSAVGNEYTTTIHEKAEAILAEFVNPLVSNKDNNNKLPTFFNFNAAKVVMQSQICNSYKTYLKDEVIGHGKKVANKIQVAEADTHTHGPGFAHSAVYLAHRGLTAALGSTALVTNDAEKMILNIAIKHLASLIEELAALDQKKALTRATRAAEAASVQALDDAGTAKHPSRKRPRIEEEDHDDKKPTVYL